MGVGVHEALNVATCVDEGVVVGEVGGGAHDVDEPFFRQVHRVLVSIVMVIITMLVSIVRVEGDGWGGVVRWGYRDWLS